MVFTPLVPKQGDLPGVALLESGLICDNSPYGCASGDHES
jgi:hypothetical protein